LGVAAGGIAHHESMYLEFSSRARLEESLLNQRTARVLGISTMREHNNTDPAEPGAIHDMKET